MRQSAYSCDDIFAAKRAGIRKALLDDKLRQCRRASHRRNAPLSLESNFGDLSIFYFKGQANDISTDWVLDFSRGIGLGDISGVAWILEMIEQLRRVHDGSFEFRVSSFEFRAAFFRRDAGLLFPACSIRKINRPAALQSYGFEIGIRVYGKSVTRHRKHFGIPT